MSLSKKNLDKLNKFTKNKNLLNHCNIKSDYTKNEKTEGVINDPLKSEDPNNIFYSLIDNSETLEETSKVNHLLKNSEINQINMNSRKANYPIKLTSEDQLYDEFNYLLDE